MRMRLALVVSLALAVAAGGRPAAASPVAVRLTTAEGQHLGQLTGQTEGRVTYFALDEVARLVGARVRPARNGTRVALIVRGKSLTLVRDQAVARGAGRTWTLSAPVRVRRGTWMVPGDFFVKPLPDLLGIGVRVVRGPARPPAAPAALAGPAPATPALARSVVLTPNAGPTAPATLPVPMPAPPERAPRPAAPDGPTPEGRGPGGHEPPPTEPPTRAGGLELRHRSYPTYTRIVLEGRGPLDPRLVEQGGSLLVTLPGLGAGPRAARPVRDGLVADLELIQARGQAVLRVTFERAPASRRVHRLADPPRVVLDFYRADGKAAAGPGAEPAGIRAIVLDAGHGGHDPGAIGPTGLREKELTLDVARRVAALLQEDPGLRVVLTRGKDQFVALRERTAFANREKADLFVSIHVNAAPARTAAGTETYFLSTEATDNAAREAAAFENRVISMEASARGGPRDVLRSILWDLTQSDFQQESSRLAEALQNSLDRALRQPSRGVKQAPFYVLGGAAMPAVLIEIGFMSNPHEEQRLRDDGYRDRIAQAIAQGITQHRRAYAQRVGGPVVR
jgi:N-acetylmuramoyl-L-alanine amidase